MKRIDRDIKRANETLKLGKVRCRIERDGNTLRLRATLPPKPGSGKVRAYQQRVVLGVGANPEGLQTAIAYAREVGLAIDRKTFTWDEYLDPAPESVEEWAERIERDYFKDKERTLTKETTWEKDYAFVYRKFAEVEKEVSIPAMRYFIKQKTKDHSSVRRRYVYALRLMANTAGLDGSELDGLIGNYEREREKPSLSDEVVARSYYKIPSPQWQWAYGVIAAYGLRNHELFFCHFDQYPLCRVLEGKTDSRWVMPAYREWADEWNLKEMLVPECTGRIYGDYGQRVSKRFYEYKKKGLIDFTAKDLRDAYAIRLSRCQVNSSVGAKSTGHSERVHDEFYHEAYGQRETLEQFLLMESRSDRPRPPKLDFD